MCNLKYVKRKFVVTYKKEEFIFAHHESAWAFIFGIRKGLENNV